MGLLDRFRRRSAAIRLRCGMCGRHAGYDEPDRNRFVLHSCDADVLVLPPDAATDVDEALDLFARSFARGPADQAARDTARDRLLYDLGEGPIPLLEDLLFRLKYLPAEPFPPPELASRVSVDEDQPRIDWSNELEMYLHRMKKYAITRRQIDEAAPSARPILEDKLLRLRTEPLEPIED